MIINIDNELERLGRTGKETPKYAPFVVSIFRDDKSRNPILVRRKTLHEAMCFVEDVTGIQAHRWVTDGGRGQLYSFTGSHASRYGDTRQWKPARFEAPAPVDPGPELAAVLRDVIDWADTMVDRTKALPPGWLKIERRAREVLAKLEA